MRSKKHTNWFDRIGQKSDHIQNNMRLLNRINAKKTPAKTSSKVLEFETIPKDDSEQSPQSLSAKSFPEQWLCRNTSSEKVNRSLRKMILDWTADSSDFPCIKPYCFWPAMPTDTPTMAVISALTRYVNVKDTLPSAPIFIYPFFPSYISRINATELNPKVARDHIIKIMDQRINGFADVENGLLSFAPMVNDNKNLHIPLTCADISSISLFDTEEKKWRRKRNPFHYIRTEKTLIKETKKRLRNVNKQGDFDGIANIFGLPFGWDFSPEALKVVIKDSNVVPELVIDLSLDTTRRVNGYMTIVKKLVKGLQKLILVFDGRIHIKVISDNPEALVAFFRLWQSQVRKQKQKRRDMYIDAMGNISGFCNRVIGTNSRSSFKQNKFPQVSVHIHGNQHFHLCQAMYRKVNEQVGNNQALAPVTSLYKWLLSAGSSLVSDELMADYLEQHHGEGPTRYIESISAAPALITRAASALNSEGLAVEWQVLLDKIRDFQQTQQTKTDSSDLLLSLLRKYVEHNGEQTALLLPTSRLIQFAINSLLKGVNGQVELIRDLNDPILNNVRHVVANGYSYKNTGILLTTQRPLSGIDWLLSTQEAARLHRFLSAILVIQDFALFHPQAQKLCKIIEAKLGQIKEVPTLTPSRMWPTEPLEDLNSANASFIPVAKITFIDETLLLVGETSELLRYDPSNATAKFSRVTPADLCIDDELLMIDAELKALFLDAVPETHHARVLGPEGIVMQYRKNARIYLSRVKVTGVEAAIRYCRNMVDSSYPESNVNITDAMLRYWCEGIFSDDIKSSPKASNNEKYFLDFSEVIGIDRGIAKLSYQEGFCKARGNHVSQGRKENVAIGQILIDRTIGRSYQIPEGKIDELVEHAIKRVNLIQSITPLANKGKLDESEAC